MATGGEGNRSQMQLGYGSCVWGTGRVTVCPPGPGATQRLSTAGMASDQDELHQSGSHREEDVTRSPPVPGQRGQSEEEAEVVIRSQWHASEEPGEGVTQLAAHSIADGKSLSQFLASWGCWQHPVDGRPSDFDGRIGQPPYRYITM